MKDTFVIDNTFWPISGLQSTEVKAFLKPRPSWSYEQSGKPAQGQGTNGKRPLSDTLSAQTKLSFLRLECLLEKKMYYFFASFVHLDVGQCKHHSCSVCRSMRGLSFTFWVIVSRVIGSMAVGCSLTADFISMVGCTESNIMCFSSPACGNLKRQSWALCDPSGSLLLRHQLVVR